MPPSSASGPLSPTRRASLRVAARDAASALWQRHPVVAAIAPVSVAVAVVATVLGFQLWDVPTWAAWVLGPVVILVEAEVLMSAASILLAAGFCRAVMAGSGSGRYADLEMMDTFRARKDRAEAEEAERRSAHGRCITPQEGLRRVGRWRPPQVVRWDILGVLGSRMFGYVASLPIPVPLRPYVYRSYARMTKANLLEVEDPLHSFRNLRSFFTRTLKPGLRPVAAGPLVSPVDGRVVVCGQVSGDRLEQVKGVTYSMAQFLGEHSTDTEGPNDRPRRQWEISEEAVLRRSGGKNRLFHLVIYLDPGDYHRMHAPVNFWVDRLRHFPGTLFPISPILTRLMPNLFALNERVVLCGEWEFGAFSFSAVGAYNVGSIEVEFDKTVSTNRIRRDLRNPNIEMMRYGGVGSHAYVRRYDEPPLQRPCVMKGRQLGLFNLGSTVVLIFEAPADFQFTVSPGEKVRLGQSIGDMQGS